MTPRSSIIDRGTEPSGTNGGTGRGDGATSRSGLVRAVLLGLLAGAVVYALSDRFRRVLRRAVAEIGPIPSQPIETLRNRIDDVLDEASPIPIGTPGDDALDAALARAPDSVPDELDVPDAPESVRDEVGPDSIRSDDDGNGTDGADDRDGNEPRGSASVDSVGVDERSPEELDRLATDEPQADPAEPGELSVDEDIVDDVIGEDERGGAHDEDERGGAHDEDERGDADDEDERGDADDEDGNETAGDENGNQEADDEDEHEKASDGNGNEEANDEPETR